MLSNTVTAHDAAVAASASGYMGKNISSLFTANACNDPQSVACIPRWMSGMLPPVSTRSTNRICLDDLRGHAICFDAYVRLRLLKQADLAKKAKARAENSF